MPMHPSKINAAIRECIDRCSGSEPISDTLADYFLHLRVDPQWSETEVRAVERVVVAMLNSMHVTHRRDRLSRSSEQTESSAPDPAVAAG